MTTTSTRQLLAARAELIQSFRTWFDELDVMEVEAPVLARSGVCDPNILSLQTQFNGETFYLQTSPEFAMKRLLADGSGDIYHIGKVFRDDPLGRHHNPEFTMIEWYRLGLDYAQLRKEVADFLAEILHVPTFDQVSYQQAFKDSLGFDPLTVNDDALVEQCQDVTGNLDRDAMLDWLLTRDVLPAYADRGIVLFDYPASQAALAKTCGPIAERFEIIVSGIELANGYTELTDVKMQARRFEEENQRRLKVDLSPMPLDNLFLTALQKGLPECAGVALGLDRLLMLKHGGGSLGEINPFMLDNV